jgi:hypothetical protein
MVFLSPSRKLPGTYLNIDHLPFLLHPIESIILGLRWSRDSSVDIEPRTQPGKHRHSVLFPTRDKRFFVLQNFQTSSGIHTLFFFFFFSVY